MPKSLRVGTTRSLVYAMQMEKGMCPLWKAGSSSPFPTNSAIWWRPPKQRCCHATFKQYQRNLVVIDARHKYIYRHGYFFSSYQSYQILRFPFTQPLLSSSSLSSHTKKKLFVCNLSTFTELFVYIWLQCSNKCWFNL